MNGNNGAGTLGWMIRKGGQYKIDLPPLSPDEEALVLSVEENFKAITRDGEIRGPDMERRLAQEVSRNAEKAGFSPDHEQMAYLARYAKMHVCGFAFLDAILADGDVEEISVIGVGKPAYVFVRKEGWKEVNALFSSEKALMDVINRMARDIGRRITFQNPRLDAMLPGGSRLHASLHPVSEGEITIRKFRSSPFSPKEMVGLGTIDSGGMALLSMLMQTDSSVVVAGNTASGKTTTLNALFSFVPRNERVLITEETPEISIPHEQQVRLVANRELGVGLMDLVYDSLRMRPDRMIVGEVRNKEEVGALFDVLLGGQARGAYATFHAQSADEAVQRFKKFGVADMDLGSIDALVVQRRILTYDSTGKRPREERRIVEIAGVLRDGKTEPALRLGPRGRGWERLWERGARGLCGKIADSFGMSRREFLAEARAREKWLCAKSTSAEFGQFFSAFQKRFYNL